MRIAFLCKRRYMGKDVILDRYARLYEIPYQLAKLGHEVRGYCVDYHAASEGEWEHEASPGKLHWKSRSLGKLRAPVLLGYPNYMEEQVRIFSPDVLLGASDIPHVALTGWLSRRLQIPYAVDLYDNFEGFGQARIPGFVSALRRSTREAGLVTTTSEPLKHLVESEYRAHGKVIALPSSVDKEVFRPGCRAAARHALGLPADVRLIGTAGGLYRDKGIVPLLEAWRVVQQAHPDVHLVLAGPTESQQPLPEGPRVHMLGHLPHVRVADLFRALDIGVISILDTRFGRYCFPQKAYEMLACNLAVVAADVGAMSDLFAAAPQLLFQAGDASSLADVLIRQLECPEHTALPIHGWDELIAEIEPSLLHLATPDGNPVTSVSPL